ncbi:MAG: DUF1329 domain-containing protein [Myxococcales bacterium]|nr:DUF1329 domain-containing protein [Myxococcales bacterium]
MFKVMPLRFAAVLSLACGLALGSRPIVRAEVQPGDTITKENQDKIKGLVADGVQWCVNRGMEMKIVPTKSIPLPKLYQEATEKFSAQVKLKEDQTLEGYVAGRPFPQVDTADPMAATKLMYNFERTHYFTDDLALHLFDADTGQLQVDQSGNQRYVVERHFVLDWLRALQFIGRLHIDPKPEIEPNKDGAFRKAGLYPVLEPFDLKGIGGLNYRYLDPLRQDDLWLYLPSLRRVRRLSSAQRSEALFGQDIDVDSYGGYAGQIPWFKWKLLAQKPMLASLHGENMPPVPCKGDGGMTFCEAWEMRPDVLVVEGTPKAEAYAYSKRVIYIDHESFFIVYTDLYDRGGELWKTVMQSIRTSTRPNPKVSFEYPEERMFIYAFTVVDMQLEHGTRVAIPGMAFQNEPGWYVDVGPKYGGEEGWFSIAALISAGH